ncbi:hypothetical protein NT6N_15220 [Oceaniferula spumae]|uniref:Fungal lipase-type domain-containing protein n=1 Tax=Oceaniferula spumae TaxID=2979115 RepID=A0AAT9FKM0_9BACT
MDTSPKAKKTNKLSRKRRFLIRGALLVAILAGAYYLFTTFWFSGRRDAYEAVDIDHLIDCVTRANSSYYEHDTIRYKFGDHIDVSDFPSSGLRVFIDREPGETGRQWIVLRGTVNLANVLADLNYVERDEHELGIRVHSGFNSAAQECLPWVQERIVKDRPICITGHSLGGSVAILLAAILDHRGYEDVSVVTFGQPKITDFHGAESLKTLNVLRVVFEQDPVPLMPPVVVADQHIDTYHHFGPEIILLENGHFYYLDEHDHDRLNVMDFWSELSRIHPKTHLLGNSYIPSLKKARERFGRVRKR